MAKEHCVLYILNFSLLKIFHFLPNWHIEYSKCFKNYDINDILDSQDAANAILEHRKESNETNSLNPQTGEGCQPSRNRPLTKKKVCKKTQDSDEDHSNFDESSVEKTEKQKQVDASFEKYDEKIEQIKGYLNRMRLFARSPKVFPRHIQGFPKNCFKDNKNALLAMVKDLMEAGKTIKLKGVSYTRQEPNCAVDRLFALDVAHFALNEVTSSDNLKILVGAFRYTYFGMTKLKTFVPART